MAQSPEILLLRDKLLTHLDKREIESAQQTIAKAKAIAAHFKIVDDKGTVYQMEAELQRTLLQYTASLTAFDKSIATFKKTNNHAAHIQALLGKAGVYYIKGEHRPAVALCSKAANLAMKHPTPLSVQATIAKLLGLSLTQTGQFAEAVRHTGKAIELFSAEKNQRQLAGTYQNLALAQRAMGDFQKATESVLHAIHLFEQQQLFLNAASALDLLGTITSENGTPHKALEYLKKAKTIREQHNDQKGLFFSYISIGSALFYMQQYPQALQAAQQAMQLLQQQNRTAELCRVHICMASVYIETEEWDSALEHCHAAQQLAHQNHDARTEAEVKSIHGTLCLRTRKYTEGKQLLEESAAMGREKELWPHVQKCEELLYEIAEAEGNATAALHHYRQVTALRKQQLDVQIQQRMLLLQMQFDAHQKDAELERLRTQYTAITTRQKETAGNYRLTPREQSILAFLTEGFSYKQIAANLGISYETTREHIANLYKKLRVGTNTEAVAKAIKEGLV